MSNLRFKTKFQVAMVCSAAMLSSFVFVKPVSEELKSGNAKAGQFLSELKTDRMSERYAHVGQAGGPDHWIARSRVANGMSSADRANLEYSKICPVIRSGDLRADGTNVMFRAVNPEKQDSLGKATSRTAKLCRSLSDSALQDLETKYTLFLQRVSEEENNIAQAEVNATASISAHDQEHSRYTGELLLAAVETFLAGAFAFFFSNPLSRLFARRREDDGKKSGGLKGVRVLDQFEEVGIVVPIRTDNASGFCNSSLMAGIVTTGNAAVIPISLTVRSTQRIKRPEKSPEEKGRGAIAAIFGAERVDKMIEIIELVEPGAEIVARLGKARNPVKTAKIWFKASRTVNCYGSYVGNWYFEALGINREEGASR